MKDCHFCQKTAKTTKTTAKTTAPAAGAPQWEARVAALACHDKRHDEHYDERHYDRFDEGCYSNICTNTKMNRN